MSARPAPTWNTHLLVALVKRDFKAQYRRSIIGPAWAVLHSVVYLALFVLIRSFLGIPSDGKPYIAFAIVAIVPWVFFSSAVGRSSSSILQNSSLLKKMAVRKEIFPIAGVILSMADLIVTSALTVGVVAWYNLPIGWSIALLPVLVVVLAVCALGMGMMVASIGVYSRDILLALPFVLQIWMFVSPIMYPLSVVPEAWRTVYCLNPMVGVLEGFRAILLDGAMPDLQMLAVSTLGAGLIFVLGWSMFKVFSQYFADVL